MTVKTPKQTGDKIVKNWFSIDHVMEIYGFKKTTIVQYISRKKIPHAIIGRKTYIDPKVADEYFGKGFVRFRNYDN